MSENESENTRERWKWRRGVLMLLGTILVGAFGSGLWELGVKPSLAWVFWAILDVLTLGSSAIKDAAYASAALDQTSIPSTHMYSAILGSLCSALLIAMSLELGFRPRKVSELVARLPEPSPSNLDGIESRVARLESLDEQGISVRRSIVRARRIFLGMLGVVMGVVIGTAMVANQSLLIWRAFHADVRMCAPYLTDSEEELLLSKYSAMKSKKDFEEILTPLRTVAKQHQLTLHSEKLW